MTEQRTDWVEQETARLFGFPLTAETLLLRPTYQDGRFDRKVCDVLLALRREGIMLSLKSQQDPRARHGAELERWCEKVAWTAADQLSAHCGPPPASRSGAITGDGDAWRSRPGDLM